LARGHRGFTLIEIAVVLIIVGLIAVGTTAMLSGVLKSGRGRASNDNSVLVQQALQRFIERYGRLPCPARTDQLVGVNAGLEDLATSDPTTTCANTLVPGTVAATTPVARGVVPWKTLGLSIEQVQDGYYRFFSYHVTPATTALSATNVNAMRGDMTIHTGTPPQLGLPPTGNQINSCMNTTTPPVGGDDQNGCNLRAVIVLLSHGENGAGAWLPTGSQLALPTTDAGEIANTDTGNASFVRGETAASGYDDIVYAWGPDDLLESLARQGSIKSAVAVTNDTLRNTAIAISNAVVNGATNCSNSAPPCGALPVLPATTGTNWPTAAMPVATPGIAPACDTVKGVVLPKDAWGTCITYAVVTNPATGNICGSPDGTFSLTSAGIDLNPTPGTVYAPTGRNDDTVLNVTVDQIRSQLATRFGAC
jgi:prepilin-type N-terminal cleavage/methylation domain-containing protein